MRRERIRLPADVEMEDRLAWGLTARQLIILALTALLAYAVFTVARTGLPLPVAAGLAAPVGLVGVALALGRRNGLSGDRLALAAVRHHAQSPRRVAAPDGLPDPLPGGVRQPGVAALGVPVAQVRESGLVELTDGTSVLALAATGTSWTLRSEEEQDALAGAYGRWLNSLTLPTAIFIRAEPVDLQEQAATITHAAGELPHPALRESAQTYARFLRDLAAEGEGLRRRRILLLLTTRTREPAEARAELERRAAETQSLLAPAGVELQVLDGVQAASVLLDALESPGPPAGVHFRETVTAC